MLVLQDRTCLTAHIMRENCKKKKKNAAMKVQKAEAAF